MEDKYETPLITKRLKVIVKSSSACGIYFVCPACRFEMLQPENFRYPKKMECPSCHADLSFPDPRELHDIHRHMADVYVP